MDQKQKRPAGVMEKGMFILMGCDAKTTLLCGRKNITVAGRLAFMRGGAHTCFWPRLVFMSYH